MEPKVTTDFFLLSIKPKNGYYYNAGNEFQYGLLGAIVMDLYRENRIAIENKTIFISNAEPTQMIFFDRILDLLYQKNTIRIESIFTRMGFRNERYKREVAAYLIQNKHIIKIRKKFLFIPYNRYYPANREQRMNIVRRMRDILLRKETPTPDDMYLLLLIKVTRLFKALSDRRDERKAIRQQLKVVLANGRNFFDGYENLETLSITVKRAIMAANTAKSAH